DAKQHKQAEGKLRPEDMDKLLQAEQLQQQIRGRVGNDKEGLRAEVNRIRNALKDNQLPPSASKDRMDSVANELERLAREELEPIEPLLNSARENADPADPAKTPPAKSDPAKPDPMKGDSAKSDPSTPDATKADPMKGDSAKADPSKPDGVKPDPMKPGVEKPDAAKPDAAKPNEQQREPLAEALKHQQEVEQTIKKLLQRLEPWSGANEVRGETRALLDEQEKLNKQTEQL